MTGKMTQIVRSHFIGLLVFSTNQMNLPYIIRNQGIVHLIMLQGMECLQSLVIPSFHIVDVTQVVYRICLMCPADILQQSKPNGSFLQITHLQVSGSQFHYCLIAFLICQSIQIAGTIESDCFGILPFFKIDRSDHRFHPIGMSGIRILLQVSLQQSDAVFRFQFILFTDTGILFVTRHIFRQHLLRHTRYGKAHQGSHPNSSFLHCFINLPNCHSERNEVE